MTVEQRSWYAIRTYSGYENKVKRNLEHRKTTLNAGDRIFRIEMPPVEAGAEWKRQFLKGHNVYSYLLVEILSDDVSLSIVGNTPGVLGVEKLEI